MINRMAVVQLVEKDADQPGMDSRSRWTWWGARWWWHGKLQPLRPCMEWQPVREQKTRGPLLGVWDDTSRSTADGAHGVAVTMFPTDVDCCVPQGITDGTLACYSHALIHRDVPF